jgi:hypothetical protein
MQHLVWAVGRVFDQFGPKRGVELAPLVEGFWPITRDNAAEATIDHTSEVIVQTLTLLVPLKDALAPGLDH